MRLSWTIARRYLFARKSHHLINVIGWVSVAGVAVSTFGLIVVLSVFNGFGNLVLSLYNSFDPDLRVTPAEGKTFEPSDSLLQAFQATGYVDAVTMVLEDNALLRNDERQYVATLKGVDSCFFKTSSISEKIIDGTADLKRGETDFLLLGAQIAYSLGVTPGNPLAQVSIFMPMPGIDPAYATLDPSSAFTRQTAVPGGVFSIQQDFDSKYVIVPLSLMRTLTGKETAVTALEIKLNDGTSAETATADLQSLAGPSLVIKDRYGQHDFLYKILRSEKAAVYLILCFILLIASFNLFGTLTILIIEKRNDLQTLFHLGANLKLARQIFMIEGLLISVGGAVTGMVTGAIVCGLQQYFGILKINGGEGFVTEAYPVAMQLSDFVLVFGIVFAIGYASSSFTSRIIVGRQSDARLKTR